MTENQEWQALRERLPVWLEESRGHSAEGEVAQYIPDFSCSYPRFNNSIGSLVRWKI